MNFSPCVYILTNKNNTVLYIGVTSNISKRIAEHKSHKYPNSFSAKYKTSKLVYFEKIQKMADAIAREKQLKAGSRLKKEILINATNTDWNDLAADIIVE
jgi:putative endonuclease